MKRVLAKWIWDLSEFTGVGLGRLAPKIFEIMTAYDTKQINKPFEP